MALRGGENFNAHTPPSVTVPALEHLPKAPDDPAAIERKEIAAKLAEARTVRLGQEALETVGRAASFDSWLRIGKALLVGKALAIRTAGNTWGQNYSRAFNVWIQAHHFDRIRPPTRSVAIELAEHADQITAWRDSLPTRQRKRLLHPLSVTRRWRAATGQDQAVRSRDLKWDAQAAWARFAACARALPPDLAQPLWQAVAAEAAAHILNFRETRG
jgi:hypothetical protein